MPSLVPEHAPQLVPRPWAPDQHAPNLTLLLQAATTETVHISGVDPQSATAVTDLLCRRSLSHVESRLRENVEPLLARAAGVRWQARACRNVPQSWQEALYGA